MTERNAKTEITRTQSGRRKARIVAAVLLACVLVLSCAGIAWGAWVSSGSASTAVATQTLRGTVHLEDGKQAPEYPGAVINNPLSVTNDGTIDAYMRVKIRKAWLSDGQVMDKLDTDLIELGFNTSTGSDWYDGGDGWFYYRKVLSPGQSTSTLFDDITISTDAGNEYANCTLRVCGFLECIQATRSAASALWGQTFADEGSSGSGAAVSSAVFEGPETGFSFSPSEDALIGSYDNVLPGESYTRTFTVKNDYSATAIIGLTARLVPQGGDAVQGAIRRDFLKNYVTLRITSADGSILYEGPAWAEGSNTTGLLNTSLGALKPGASQTVTVTLSVAAGTGNEYEGIDVSTIGWKLTANEDTTVNPESGGGASSGSTSTSTTTSVSSAIRNMLPKTGDPWTFAPWALVALASASALVALFAARRRRDDEDDVQTEEGMRP